MSIFSYKRRKHKGLSQRCQISIKGLETVLKSSVDESNSNNNIILSMFVLFVNSITHNSFTGRKVKIPKGFKRYMKKKRRKPKNKLLCLLINRIRKVPINSRKWVSFLPTLENYFLDVVTMRSKIFSKKVKERVYFDTKNFKPSDNLKYRRHFKSKKELFILFKPIQTPLRHKIELFEKFSLFFNKTKNINFYNPNYLAIQYALYLLVENIQIVDQRFYLAFLANTWDFLFKDEEFASKITIKSQHYLVKTFQRRLRTYKSLADKETKRQEMMVKKPKRKRRRIKITRRVTREREEKKKNKKKEKEKEKEKKKKKKKKKKKQSKSKLTERQRKLMEGPGYKNFVKEKKKRKRKRKRKRRENDGDKLKNPKKRKRRKKK